MLERILGGGEPGGGEARRGDAGLGGAAGLQRLGHGAEIGDHAGRHRGGHAERLGRLGGVELAQIGAGGGRGDRAEHRRRVPALAVIGILVALDQMGPHLVARDIGGDGIAPARAQRLGLGEDGGNEDDAGMAGEGDIVIVEGMAGDRVGERRLRGGRAFGAEIKARLAGPAACAKRFPHDARDRLVDAGEHHRDAIGDAGAHHVQRRLGQRLVAQFRDEATERPRDRGGHGGDLSADGGGERC